MGNFANGAVSIERKRRLLAAIRSLDKMEATVRGCRRNPGRNLSREMKKHDGDVDIVGAAFGLTNVRKLAR